MPTSATTYAMAAFEKGGPEVLQKIEWAPMAPGPGEVQIEHHAIGVNFIDCYFRTGLYPWADASRLIPGSEAAGIITAIGEGVTSFKPGDRVAYTLAHNAYATHRTIAAQHVVALPDDISFATAASVMLKGLTTRYLLKNSFAVKPGQQVLFHAAAGGVGLLAGQWMKALGVAAIGTAGGPEKCALAKANGYAHVIDYRAQDFVAEVKSLAPQGCHVVYDSVGRDSFTKSLQCLARHGTMVSFGQSSGPVTDFKVTDLSAGSFYLTRPTLFHFASDRAWLEQAAAELFGLIGKGDIVVKTNSAKLEDVAQVHRQLEGRQTTGSTILIP